MGRKTRKFIDKKRDIVHIFKVVQRSQKDPLLVDETAPQAVLVDTYTSESHQEELHKYGIYFDDGYDYLQHLRGVKEVVDWEQGDMEVYTIRKEDLKQDQSTLSSVGLVLPSSAFESYVEEPIGLLNRAAPITGPRPELDPDIVAELDSDESLDGDDVYDPGDADALPDNFVTLLNSEVDVENNIENGEFKEIEQWLLGSAQSCAQSSPPEVQHWEHLTSRTEKFEERSEDESDCDSHHALFLSDEERDDVPSLHNIPVRKKTATDIASRTSASSATVLRSELLSILDEKFDKLYNEEYTDEQIGPLHGEIIEGPFNVDSEVFQQAIQSTKKQFERNLFYDTDDNDRDDTVRWVRESARISESQTEEQEENEMTEIEVKPKCPYDCESILSTYSTTQNRPHLIDDRDIFNKRRPKLTVKALRKHNREEGDTDSTNKDVETLTLLSCISAISIRPKDETQEEKKERKSALKELRKERRKEKKLSQLAFKEEMKRQKKIITSQPRSRVIAVV